VTANFNFKGKFTSYPSHSFFVVAQWDSITSDSQKRTLDSIFLHFFSSNFWTAKGVIRSNQPCNRRLDFKSGGNYITTDLLIRRGPPVNWSELRAIENRFFVWTNSKHKSAGFWRKDHLKVVGGSVLPARRCVWSTLSFSKKNYRGNWNERSHSLKNITM